MHYQLTRNGQSYGPYTLDDLRRYLASGNVLPADLVKNDDMPEWMPVSQVLAGSASPGAESAMPARVGVAGAGSPGTGSPGAGTPGASYPGANAGYVNPAYAPAATPAMAASAYPDAPNLHWGLVLLFGTLTGTLFMFVWNLVIAAWLKRVQPNATSIYYYIGFGVLTLVQLAVTIPYTLHQVMSPGVHMAYNPVGSIFGLVAWVVKLIARFSQRASLEEHFNTAEPVGLRLSAAMTFFFGGLYFQYHLNRIHAMKQAARYGAPRAY